MEEEYNLTGTRITELNRSIQEVDGKVNGLMSKANLRRQDKEDSEFLKGRIQALKNDQENLRNDFVVLVRGLFLSGLQIEELPAKIEELENEQDDLKKRLNELMVELGQGGTSSFMAGESVNDEVEAINNRGIEVVGAKIAQLLELVWCCFMVGESKKQRDFVCVNEQVESIKQGAIEVGIKISRLLVDVMIMLSERNVLMLQAKFKDFRFSLERKSSAIRNIIANVLGMADRELIIVEKAQRAVSYGGSYDKIDVEGSDSVVSISVEEKITVGSEFQKLLDKFHEEIELLNLILNCPAPADLKNLNEKDVSALKARLKKCENDLRAIERNVISDWAPSSLFCELTDLKNLKETMEGKINQIWKGWSEEKKQ